MQVVVLSINKLSRSTFSIEKHHILKPPTESNVKFTVFHPVKIRPLKIEDFQTRSSMILVGRLMRGKEVQTENRLVGTT